MLQEMILKMPPVYTSKGGSRKKSAYSLKNYVGFQKLRRLHPKASKVKCPKQEYAADTAACRGFFEFHRTRQSVRETDQSCLPTVQLKDAWSFDPMHVFIS
jgi:hypothetical protein